MPRIVHMSSINLKKLLLLMCFLLLTAGILFSQSSLGGLRNSTNGTAFFISLPTNELEYTALYESPDTLKGLIRQYSDRITAVPSGGLYSSVPLFRQDTLVFGYVLLAGELVHPLFLLRIASGSAGQFFDLNESSFIPSSDSAFEGFVSISDELPYQPSHQIDGRIIDWLQTDDALRFSSSFKPLRIRRESESTSAEIQLDDSLYWSRGGTALDRLRLSLDQDFLYGMSSSYGQLQDGLSLLLYYYQERNEETVNLYTIEVAVSGDVGQVLLWDDQGNVQICGNYHRGDFFLEFQIHREYLPIEIQQSLQGSSDGSFDVSTGFSDGVIYEEFLFANLPIASQFNE